MSESAAVSAHNSRPKAWIYEQYDQLCGSRTVRRPGLDAAVLRLRPSVRGLAVSLQGPPPGERDPFGIPPPGPSREVVTVPGDHGLKADLEAVAAAVRAWLPQVVAP